jgi:hypothetical protein
VTTLRPRSTADTPQDQRAALAAPVADALWMLARQWQTRGFVADDAGSPVRVRLSHVTAPLLVDGIAATGAIEPRLEAEPRPAPGALDAAERARMAMELLRRLRDAGVGAARIAALRDGLSGAYPLQAASPASPCAVFAGRLPDAAALFDRLAALLAPDGSGDPFPELPGLDPGDASAQAALRDWFAWMGSQLGEAGGELAPAAWDHTRLEYAFEAAADLPAGRAQLRAPDYDGTGADWHSFDRSNLPPLGAAPAPEAVEVRPAPVTYPGMPRPRFWEFEDGHVNLDLMAGAGPAHRLLTLFAHAYSNDWFLVPLEVPPGATLITALEVTDTFGTTTVVPAAAALDGPASRWKLWELTSDDGEDTAAGLRLHLPIAAAPLEGPVVEEVLLARDEMANLAWLIELVTRDADGTTVDRYRRWLGLRAPADADADPRALPTSYALGTPLPDYWYPLIAATGPNDERQLRLASVPPEAIDVPDEGVRGRLVAHIPGTALADEEASRAGTRLLRVDRLLRTAAGRAVWRARIKQPGTGEAASGLRFDVLR